MSRWIIVLLIVVSLYFSNSEDCDQEGDEEDDECCEILGLQKQVAPNEIKTPQVPKLPLIDQKSEELPRQVHFTGLYLPVPGILYPNQGLRGPLNDQSNVLMVVMQSNCNLVIYAYKIGIDNALWQSKTQQYGQNCTLHANRDWTLDIRDHNGLKIWTSGLRRAYLDKAARLLVVPTSEQELNIRLALFNKENTKNIIIE